MFDRPGEGSVDDIPELLSDELVSIEAIYGPGTLVAADNNALNAILTLPAKPDISLRIGFPLSYPEDCPFILGTESTGQDVAKGEGVQLAQLLEAVLQEVWVSGEPCIFTLIEEATARLSSQVTDQRSADTLESAGAGLDVELHSLHESIQSNAARAESAIDPDWTLSEVITEKKSVFLARVTTVSSPSEAKQYLSHLLATDKKAAKATHNITAWRIRGENGIQYQDCDDDGETAAGGRLLHLLELVDAWNVMVVVTRWYGGVHLGPDRFRLINQAARDALVAAGVADQGGKKKGKK